jgi:hypothetical protein
MPSVKLNKAQKKDFCNHMANKLFKRQLDAITDEITGMAEPMTRVLATPKQIEASAALPDTMLCKVRSFTISLTIVHQSKWRFKTFCIDLPQLTPVPFNGFSSGPAALVMGYSRYVNIDNLPHWLTEAGKDIILSQFSPLLESYGKICKEKMDFEESLSTRMAQVSTLNKLKEASAELHDEWVAYFGDAVNTPPAVIFDDVLKVMAQQKQANA